eukprot:TRINITY_DN19411_c0_g1_i1.p2 TRINITY_DN19411_c0_g1~~TRINITY_DN19411_c0_g1_i1.p2  ORF type:complete len:265 (+),score=58.89 TRINITY_DN19411_c0_g1_i1:1020-1814(+)
MIMTCVDMSLAPEKASTKAIEKLLHSVELSGVGILASFKPPDERQRYDRPDQVRRSPVLQRLMEKLLHMGVIEHMHWQPDHIQAIQAEASDMGAEAALEPRYQEDPWPDALFQQLTRIGNTLRSDLHQVQHAIDEEHRHAYIFGQIRAECAHFQEVEKRLKEILGPTLELMALALMPNKTRTIMEKEMELIKIDDAVGELKCMEKLINEINKKVVYEDIEYTEARGMDGDDICRINAALMMYTETAETLAEMSKACIEATFISE